jgi:hypothetical protein
MARSNSPCASGDVIIRAIDAEPAETPNTVTLPGSPPKPAIFSRTQRNAAI